MLTWTGKWVQYFANWVPGCYKVDIHKLMAEKIGAVYKAAPAIRIERI
jgi:hypothetical protein